MDDRNNNNFPNKNVINSESFKYKKSVTGSIYNVDEKITNAEGKEIDNPTYDANKSGKKEVEIAVALKYLSSFWRTLDMSLINCKVSLILTWSWECVITSMERRVKAARQRDTSPMDATFQITDTNLNVLVVTLSTENGKTFRTIKNRI